MSPNFLFSGNGIILYEDYREDEDDAIEADNYEYPTRYDRYEIEAYNDWPRVRSRSPLRHAESLEELNSRRLALESELPASTRRKFDVQWTSNLG